MPRPNERLIDSLERTFGGYRGFYAKCTMYIPYDELLRMVGYAILYGREPNKAFSLAANKYINKTISSSNENDK